MMHKKKLLFIMDTFPLGGISKSLLALFNELGNEYHIDFMLMKQEGLFIPLLPSNVNLISPPIEEAFRNPHPKNIVKAFKTLSFARLILWIKYSFKCSISRCICGLSGMVCTMDEEYAKLAEPVEEIYDAGIAYQGGRCIYYLIEKVNAKVKIGYVHNDYSASEVDYMMKQSDEKYFPKLDHIITISPKCVASLHSEFPALIDRCQVIENICSLKMIRSMAGSGDSFNDNFTGLRLITMGRFDINQKGIDYAIAACKILKERNYKFRWYFLGDGAERPVIERMIKQYDVGDKFILLGAMTNPYAYIYEADIYVQPSRFEGKSVALDEVKALAKPVVVTNFSTVHDQFTNLETALITEMSPEDIADKIECLINDAQLRIQLSENLRKEKVGNEDQADIFRRLVEEGKSND